MTAGPPAVASARRAAWLGLIGLASAMGIGRFAFTPLLPLMQERFGLTVAQGGSLASANYLGYLIGALLCLVANPPPGRAARWGLAAVALSTLAMALTQLFWLWALLRFVAGLASAYVLVGVSAWVLSALLAHGRPAWSGWVFTGVGVGISVAGLVALAAGASSAGPAPAWIALGAAAAGAAGWSWRHFVDAPTERRAAESPTSAASSFEFWRLLLCYGVFGYGYIIPATFLPSLARSLVADPAVFGWAWPVFGLAAALSTVLAATVWAQVSPRRLWVCGQSLMAAGVALPALQLSLGTVLASAVAVGASFVVLTMAALREARRVAGDAAPRLMAAMTAAFAIGQLIGPLTVVSGVEPGEALRLPSLLGASLLLVGALGLCFAVPKDAAAVPQRVAGR